MSTCGVSASVVYYLLPFSLTLSYVCTVCTGYARHFKTVSEAMAGRYGERVSVTGEATARSTGWLELQVTILQRVLVYSGGLISLM